ncbi:melatonin receptor type 1A isoform X2 [Ciona intestinalis]
MFPTASLVDMGNSTTEILQTNINATDQLTSEGFTALPVVKIIVMLNLMLVGIIGNILVIASVKREKQLNIPGNFFIVNLAFADLIITGISMPIILHNVIKEVVLPASMIGYEQNIFCQASAYLKVLALHVSWYSFAFIAVNRYYSVCRPIQYPYHFRRDRIMKTIWLIWLWVFIINFPVIVGWAVPSSKDITNSSEGYYDLYPKNRPPVVYDNSTNDCVLGIQNNGGYLFANGIFVVALPLLTIAFCYSLVFMAIIKNRRRLQSTMGTDQLKRRFQTERRTFLMLLAVVMLFVVSWMPVIIYEYVADIEYTSKNDTTTDIVRLIVTWLALSNSMMNPILYAFLNRSFRIGFRHVIMDFLSFTTGKMCGCCNTGEKLSSYFYTMRSINNETQVQYALQSIVSTGAVGNKNKPNNSRATPMSSKNMSSKDKSKSEGLDNKTMDPPRSGQVEVNAIVINSKPSILDDKTTMPQERELNLIS